MEKQKKDWLVIYTGLLGESQINEVLVTRNQNRWHIRNCTQGSSLITCICVHKYPHALVFLHHTKCTFIHIIQSWMNIFIV